VIEGFVEISGPAVEFWVQPRVNHVLAPGTRLRTGPESRVLVQWSESSEQRFGPSTETQIVPPRQPGAPWALRLVRGVLSFFVRDRRTRIDVLTTGGTAATRGTEFVMRVALTNNTERTTLWVIDGVVEFGNALGPPIRVTSLQQAEAEVGQRPRLLPGFIIANDVLQWVLYYPAVLDPAELPLTPDEQATLGESLAAYRQGDILTALERYPDRPAPPSPAGRIYHAALLLAVGKVQQSEPILEALLDNSPEERIARLAQALRQLIAAVKFQDWPGPASPRLASEFMAASYYAQSRGTGDASLHAALDLAQKAAAVSPEFGIARARIAELQFSFGRTGDALAELNRSLSLAPLNPQALALRGFLSAAQNDISEALGWFDRAIAVHGAIGSAWLGRGLSRIRKGDMETGTQDLLTAAALEPQRSLFRSYLGKAYADRGDLRAGKELQLATNLAPNDPTPWLYSALLNQQSNRINQAIRDLEQSQDLHENRRLYRSRLLLDQDRAVAGANLASIYRDAGMIDVSVREAVRAVNYDYASYSAHLFLANSYDQLRDPRQIHLRYETPWLTEYLLANLLAPVGAGTLSQTVSQQEYSKLFERDRLGITSSTEYYSRGAWYENGAQFGTFGNTGYALDASYSTDPGYRPNNDFEQRTLSLQLKQQLTPKDTLYFQALNYDATGGDLTQHHDPAHFNPGLRFNETQEPILVAGYHHEWAPGNHTLFLATRLNDTLSVTDPYQNPLLISRRLGQVVGAADFLAEQDYRSTLDIYTAEIQQIWQTPVHNTIVGARFQTGDFQTRNTQRLPANSPLAPVFFPPTTPPSARPPIASQDLTAGFQRVGVYGYHSWRVTGSLQLIAGLAYDQLRYPENFRFAPVSESEETIDQVSPKAGIIWTPARHTTVRAAYSRSLGGASFDQSFRLEPPQVAGFNQAYRSIIPESIAASNAGERFETWGLSIEQRLGTGTYIAISGEILKSDIDRIRGTFQRDDGTRPILSGTPEHLEFQERSFFVTVDQLIGHDWSLGVRYRVSQASLDSGFPQIPPDAAVPGVFRPTQETEAILHQLQLQAIYNDRSGFFARIEALWNHQNNAGYDPDIPDDDFWHLNLFAGYRFPRRKAELMIGLLNLTDQDYQVNPLNLYRELPHERTLMARLQFSF
jgi:tetratricopeptide (TPR) repeat protein